jgi:hypothetical protein
VIAYLKENGSNVNETWNPGYISFLIDDQPIFRDRLLLAESNFSNQGAP